MISRWLKISLLCTGTVLLLARPLTAAQFIVSTNAGDYFEDLGDSLGRDTNGTVWIIGGRSGIPALFQSSGGNLIAATLVPLAVEYDTYALAISRDARHVVGISGDEATFWNVATPGVVQGLGIPAGRSYSAAHGVSTGTNPIVVGFSGISSFVWDSASGIEVFANPQGHGGPRLTGISADGQTFIGFANANLTSVDPFVYQNGTSTFLNESGGILSSAIAVSPDGNVVGGHIDQQGAIWRKGTNWQDSTPLRLSINGNPVGRVIAVSDTGFAVGSVLNGGFIYGYIHDPRTGVTSWFDDWWRNEAGSAVPHHVTVVNDVYEAGGQIYFALTLTNGVALASLAGPPTITIARLPSGQIELRWPTNRNGIIKSTPDLIPPAWLPLTNAVPTQNNRQFVLILPATNAATFFRLQMSSP